MVVILTHHQQQGKIDIRIGRFRAFRLAGENAYSPFGVFEIRFQVCNPNGPGTGQVDFAAVLSRLGQGGFTSGPLLIETLLPGGDGKDPLDRLRGLLPR